MINTINGLRAFIAAVCCIASQGFTDVERQPDFERMAAIRAVIAGEVDAAMDEWLAELGNATGDSVCLKRALTLLDARLSGVSGEDGRHAPGLALELLAPSASL